jgi:hypothetical protein
METSTGGGGNGIAPSRERAAKREYIIADYLVVQPIRNVVLMEITALPILAFGGL